MKKIRTNVSFSFSMLGHFALACCFFSWHFFSKCTMPLMSVSVPSYIAVPQTHGDEKTFKKIMQKKQGVIPVHEKAIIKKSTQRNKSEKIRTTTPNKNILLQQLHAAIFSKENYPEAAFLLHQKGVVQVGLMMNPQGEISHVMLLKSSQYPMLDEAALDAVKAVTPLHDANQYLKTATPFSVEVVFG